MRRFIQLTDMPIRTGAVPATQPLYLASDVADMDVLDLEMSAWFDGTSAFNLTVEILTAPQVASEDGWVTAGNLNVTGASSGSSMLTLSGGFMRFIRWKLTAVAGGPATFLIRGVGRRR
jgi:hypothetical protein